MLLLWPLLHIACAPDQSYTIPQHKGVDIYICRYGKIYLMKITQCFHTLHALLITPSADLTWSASAKLISICPVAWLQIHILAQEHVCPQIIFGRWSKSAQFETV